VVGGSVRVPVNHPSPLLNIVFMHGGERKHHGIYARNESSRI
jgi:hypothetical protein